MSERTVFITGCSSGIGLSTAGLFAECGCRVAVTARREEDVTSLRHRFEKYGENVLALPCDVADDDSSAAAVQAAEERFGGIDILINNAGYGQLGPVETVPLDKVRYQFEVNTLGPARLIRLVLPSMRKRGEGRIINVSSILGRVSIPFSGWYCASKHALEGLSDSLRLELEPFGIRVISILPGPVETEFRAKADSGSDPDRAPAEYRDLFEKYRLSSAARKRWAVKAEDAGKLILKVANLRNPRPRYYITVPARSAAMLRRWTPDGVWHRMTRMAYGIRRVSGTAGSRECR